MSQTQTHERLGIVSSLNHETIYAVDHHGDHSSMEMLIGNSVLQALEDSVFTDQWDQLSHRCTWSTVFQGRAFVTTWYKLYHSQFLPVIIRSFQNGKLTGLLTLVKENRKNSILVAGAGAAHYQVWLADQDQGEEFIKHAMRALRHKFPQCEINFYNAPPQTPLDWATKDPIWKHRCTVRPFRRPLIDFRDPNIMEVINSRRSRKRLNQLKKVGDVKLEHVVSLERFSEVLEVLADQFDFRKAAKYNWVEFRADPLKKKLLIELFREGILHVTLLTLDGKIIASITDTIGDDKWIHGTQISTHCCSHAKHSPGILNFLLLGQLLMHEGYHVYDLTPGNDLYKERLANAYDHVYKITITGTLQTYIKNRVELPLRAITKNALDRANLRSKDIKDKARFLRYKLQFIKPTSFLSTMLASLVNVSKELKPIAVPISPSKTDLLSAIKSDSLSDLLDYKPDRGGKSKWDFMAEAMHRLENEETPYTLSRNGQLLFCCWLCKQHAATAYQDLKLPDESLVLHGLYHHGIEAQELREILANVASHICAATNTTEIFLVTPTSKTKPPEL